MRYQDADAADIELALDRLRALAPDSVCYDSPRSRRG